MASSITTNQKTEQPAADNHESGEYEKEFTPKTAKRKISRSTVITALIVIVLIGAGVAGYFIYQGTFYYQTNNAKVDTVIHQISANTTGQLLRLYVAQGEAVAAGQVLAQVQKGPLIRSPIDGTVTNVMPQAGDYVSAADVILVVAKTSDMYITANVEETNILKIKVGQPVAVYLDAYGRNFDGYVAEVASVTSTKLSGTVSSFTTSGTYTKVTQLIPVKIKLADNVDLTNIIGTNATVKIRIK
ncbi:MAG: HlyD family efflux transporter periplasmic adaptor subunit [Caldilineaceae bacterium]|nr:HlyD family efflux transporter periplasmic adaptor subunit [Caldilineaceae bacterium]